MKSICRTQILLHDIVFASKFITSEIKLVDDEVDKSKSEIERLKEEITKLEQTKKGDASSRLEELETKVKVLTF